MPAGGEIILAGQYTVTWNGVALGIMKGDADVPALEQQAKTQAVDSTDKYGKATIDDIAQGADWYAQFVCLEYKTGVIAAWWPYGALGLMGIIGRRLFDLSAPLVLTTITGTPAAGSPNTLTSAKAILAPGFNTKILFGPQVREVPIRLRLYPYDTNSPNAVYGWFTQT